MPNLEIIQVLDTTLERKDAVFLARLADRTAQVVLTELVHTPESAEVVQATEVEPGHLTPEAIAEWEAYWEEHDGPLWVGCGDDRAPTAQSALWLADGHPEILNANEAYASMFGGAAGIAKNVLIAYAAQHGREAGRQLIEQYGGFNDMLTEVVSRMASDTDRRSVRPILHSAANKENEYGTFNVHGHGEMGCAYCGGVGAVSGLLLDPESSLIADVARSDLATVFGSTDYTDELFDAHGLFLELATDGHGASFALNRGDYVDQIKRGMPVMILAGNHAPARTTGLIHNFDLETVGSASKAAADGKPFYRQDMARVTEAILRNFPELALDPEVLMRSFFLDSEPVRAVLASHDNDPELKGVLDPRSLAVGIRGNIHTTIERLRLTA